MTDSVAVDPDRFSDWLAARVAYHAKVPPSKVARDEAFVNLGLSSRDAIVITGEIEEFLGIEELEPSLLWDYPTIEKLAAHLAQSA